MNTNILSDGKSKTHSWMLHTFFECPSGCLCAGLDFKCILHGACGAIKNETKPKNKLQRKGQSFWGQANGTWSFPHPRRPAINALPQLVFLGFPHLQPSFPNSQPKTEMSMGPIPILPPHLYPFGCKYAGAGAGACASDANVFGCLWKQFPLVSAIKKQYHLEST